MSFPSRRFGSFVPALSVPALSVLLLAAPAIGQTTATLSGVIKDASGAVVPNATVTVTGNDTGTTRAAQSDSAGIYIVPSLLPGNYRVTVQAQGFGQYTVERLQLDVDQKITVNAQLSVESAGQTVEVNSTNAGIVADTVTVGSVLDQKTVQELPLNGRHFLDLTVLTPGGVTAPSAGSLTAPSRGLGANSYITAGNREDSANFQINGVNLNDNSQNQITFQPSINTTSEFKIDNSTYSAEYGRSSGSIVNVSTRSGTNGFHGEVFDYNRNNSFDTRNYFNPKGTAQNALKRNNFGAALGGPIVRDKAFFFGSYEGLRQHQTIVTNGGVLTNAQRAAVLAVNNPTAVALLALIPVANTASTVMVGGVSQSLVNRYVGSAAGPVNVDQATGDVFYQFSPKNQLHGFYAFQKDIRTEPTLQGNNIPGFGDHRAAHRQVATLSFYHIFSSTLSNEARIGGNRIGIAFTPNVTANPTTFNIDDGINAAVGIPQISIVDAGTNLGGPSGFPQGRTDNLGLFNDTLTYLRGKHTIRTGGEYRRSVNNSFNDDTGTLTFNLVGANAVTGATTGVGAGNGFVNAMANGFSITPTAVNSRLFINAAAAFVEDTYKVTQNFNLELGFRFEWNGTPTEGADRQVIFNLATAQLQQVHRAYNQNFNYEPRVGFTLDPYKNGKTVFRGAYGIMADQPVSGVVSGLAGNPPFATGVSYSNSTAPLPVASIFTAASGSALALTNVRPNFSNAYTETYNFNLQQQFPQNTVFSVGYYGSEGKHLRIRLNDNQPFANGTRPYTAISPASLYKPGASLTQANIAQPDSISKSMYNAMWATVTKGTSVGLQFLFTYNWSKSMDENSLGSQGGYTLQDSNNPLGNYGLSDFDVRHRIAANAIYDFPNFSRQLHLDHLHTDRLLSGFRLSGIEQWQTGNPVNVTNTSTFSGVNGVIRPNQVGNVVRKKIETVSAVTFFQAPTCTTVVAGCVFQNTTNSFGNVRRNSITGPGFSNLDLSLEKNTKLTERLNLQLRVDAFDVANHPSFANPTGTDTSATFGQSTATRFPVADSGSSRQLQLVGKITF